MKKSIYIIQTLGNGDEEPDSISIIKADSYQAAVKHLIDEENKFRMAHSTPGEAWPLMKKEHIRAVTKVDPEGYIYKFEKSKFSSDFIMEEEGTQIPIV